MSHNKEALILMLAAQPRGTNQIHLDDEARAIRKKLSEGDHRGNIRLETYWAVQPDDVMEALGRHRPIVVHFSGHGNQNAQLELESAGGSSHFVSGKGLASLFRVMGEQVRVVALNSCYSAAQAEEITRFVDVAVGMNGEIGIEAAIRFSAAFYRGLGFGKSVFQSFEEGLVALELYGIPEMHIPMLHSRDGVDPRSLVLREPYRACEDAGDRQSIIELKGPKVGQDAVLTGIKGGQAGDRSEIRLEDGEFQQELEVTGIKH